MRTVQDGDGKTYLLLKRSDSEWLIRDPETDQETYRPPADLEMLDEESPLSVAAKAVSQPLRRVLTAVRTERSLGLLLELERDGPLSVRAMLDRFEYCESDLHGQLAEFRAAGLIEERRVTGERGYGTTETASDALETLEA
ncbi:DUF7346 family protein [Halorhabdus amylolytica]|uniref:DUF7346 family protein n=1 Tax=Halorhabdus amylolytica TaxID=2559573 RepID=UPI0010A9CA52|nr:hypothetical protein [Halorhabdus amylolytica]